jgi:hypothetical protein
MLDAIVCLIGINTCIGLVGLAIYLERMGR